MLKPYAAREHAKMKEVLMNPDAPGPEVHYYMIRGGPGKRNVTVLEPGMVGGEYIKTYGHYHVGKIDETYWIVQGEGIVILQSRAVKNGKPVNDEIDSFKAISVKAGDKVYIPAEIGHLLVNVGKTWLVTIDDSPVNFDEVDPVSLPGHADYEPVKRMRGFAYYVVEKNGKPEFVRNTLYKKAPDVEFVRI